MKVHITTEPKLIKNLHKAGISDAQISDFEQRIQEEFEQDGKLIFNDILKISTPLNLDVQLCEHDYSVSLNYAAAFFSNVSSADYLVFKIYEDYILFLIQNPGKGDLRTSILHELIHSADFEELRDSDAILKEINDKTKEYYVLLSHYAAQHPYQYLYNTLYLMSHYRAEGMAILGSSILTNQKIIEEPFNFNDYLNIFQSEVIANLYSPDYHPNKHKHNYQVAIAYKLAGFVLFHVLKARKELEESTLDKIHQGMINGNYDLSQEEIQNIFSKCFNLSLTEFIAGLVMDDQNGITLLPVKNLLTFCANITLDNATDDMDAFEALLHQNNQSIEDLNKIFQSILDLTLTPEEIRKRYRNYCQSQDVEDSPLKPKIDRLYEEYLQLNPGIIRRIFNWKKDDDNTGINLANETKKELIGWALTYFFTEEDLIKDRIPVYGYLDDMLIIDRAMHCLSLQDQASS